MELNEVEDVNPLESDFAKRYIREKLSSEKVEHSLGVADIALELAQTHSLDEEKASLAGIYHDICREWSDEDTLRYAETNGVMLSDEIKERPAALGHGVIASHFLKKELGIPDDEILRAIETHTLGASKMSDIQKVLFISDFIESTLGLKKSGESKKIAEKDLNKAVKVVYEKTFDYLKKKNISINTTALENSKHY